MSNTLTTHLSNSDIINLLHLKVHSINNEPRVEFVVTQLYITSDITESAYTPYLI